MYHHHHLSQFFFPALLAENNLRKEYPEMHCMNIYKELYADVQFLHITRNPFSVIESAVERDWYSDEYMGNMIDWVEVAEILRDDVEPDWITFKCDVPWWIDGQSKVKWRNWNLPTRNACVWRNLMEHYFNYNGDIPHTLYWVTYEDLCKYPEVITERLAEIYGLEITEITKRHLAEIRKNIREPKLTIDDIEEPEKSKFANLAERLGYL